MWVGRSGTLGSYLLLTLRVDPIAMQHPRIASLSAISNLIRATQVLCISCGRESGNPGWRQTGVASHYALFPIEPIQIAIVLEPGQSSVGRAHSRQYVEPVIKALSPVHLHRAITSYAIATLLWKIRFRWQPRKGRPVPSSQGSWSWAIIPRRFWDRVAYHLLRRHLSPCRENTIVRKPLW